MENIKQKAREDIINLVEEEIGLVDGACYKNKERDKRCIDFIDQIIDLAIAERDRQVAEMIQKKVDAIYSEPERTEDDVTQAHAFEEIIEDITNSKK